MEHVKRTGRVIDPDHWPDSAAEEREYWLSRPPSERVDFARRLTIEAYRRVHGHRPPQMRKVGRIFKPEP